MKTTQKMIITLPNEMAAQVKARVASGEYASESEVIREGLRALMARDDTVEQWLREKVVPAREALQRGETESLSGNDVWLEQQISPAFSRYVTGDSQFISNDEMNSHMDELKARAVQGKL